MRSKLGCFIFLMITMTSLIFAGTVYYVDATSGNDLNDGLSPATAWQTIAKVKGTLFFPGDNIYFKRGEVWREQLTVPSSGSSGNPITFGAYGNGNAPIINGANLVVGWAENFIYNNVWQATFITNANQVFFDGIRGNKQDSLNNVDSYNDWYWANNILYIYSTSDPYTNYTSPGIEASIRNCVYISGKDYITIENLDTKYAIYYNIWPENGSTNIIIDSCIAQYSGFSGIGCNDGNGPAINLVTIKNCTVHHNGGCGIFAARYTTNWTIKNNTSYNDCASDVSNIADSTAGIKVWSSTSSGHIIENNTIYNGGSDSSVLSGGHGIWIDEPTDPSNCIVRYNICYDNKKNGITLEKVTNCDVYYNVCYSNGSENGVGMYLKGTNALPCEDNTIYNNVFYDSVLYALQVRGDGVASMVNNFIRNNIFFVSGEAQIASFIDGGENDGTNGSGNVYEYNCFGAESANFIEWGDSTYKSTYDDWETAYGRSTHSVEFDSSLTNPTSDFSLQVGSPCINEGTDVGLTQDYAGNTVPAGWAVDIGAYEYQGGVSPPLSAEINASPTSGWIPLTVNFTGSATGGTEPYSYSWDFGDDGSSNEQNPSHTYSEAGDYTVILTVTDRNSDQDTDSLIIHASEKTDTLEASVTASPTSGQAPLDVSFSASASGGTAPYTYSWNFGDENSSSDQNPSHTYNSAGTYSITLTVADSTSSQATDSLTITATSPPAVEANLSISSSTGSPAPGAGGTTDPSPGNHSYSVGNSVQVEVIPNEHYRFSKWTGDVSDSETYNKEVSIIMDKDKSISAFFCTKCGDVTGDLNITPADSQAAFEIFLGIISNPTESEKENADVNCSGTKTEPNITPGDAQAIFEKFLGINELPSDCSGCSRSGSVLALKRFIPMRQASDVNLIVNDVRVDQGGEVVVPIIVDNPFNIKAFGFELIFPSEVLEFVGVERSGLLEDFYQVDANKIAEGVVRAGGYGSEAIKSHSPRVLITLIFKVIGEAEYMGLDSFSIVNTVDDIKNASVKKERLIDRERGPRDIRRQDVRIK